VDSPLARAPGIAPPLQQHADSPPRLSAPPPIPLAAGLVPTLSNSEQQGERSGLTPGGSDELVVPSHAAANFDLSLPGELPMPQLGLLGMKRRASDQASDGLMPAAKQYLETDLQAPYQPRAAPAAYAPQQQQYHQQQQQQYQQQQQQQWAAYPSAPPPPAQATHYQQHHQHHSHHHHHALGTGSDMTREERVARCVGVWGGVGWVSEWNAVRGPEASQKCVATHIVWPPSSCFHGLLRLGCCGCPRP